MATWQRLIRDRHHEYVIMRSWRYLIGRHDERLFGRIELYVFLDNRLEIDFRCRRFLLQVQVERMLTGIDDFDFLNDQRHSLSVCIEKMGDIGGAFVAELETLNSSDETLSHLQERGTRIFPRVRSDSNDGRITTGDEWRTNIR